MNIVLLFHISLHRKGAYVLSMSPQRCRTNLPYLNLFNNSKKVLSSMKKGGNDLLVVTCRELYRLSTCKTPIPFSNAAFFTPSFCDRQENKYEKLRELLDNIHPRWTRFVI